MELTILMPCLNEAETLAICIRKAKQFLSENLIDGEVLISDNGSTDGSQDIAVAEGARVVHAPIKGYGGALIKGCQEAKGKYVIMGDADDSYDFLQLTPFVEKLREGYDLVIGNRFAGGIENGAMPWIHRYIGNPFLSSLGRLLYRSKVRDFHCGLRGYNRESLMKLQLRATGMEYASEMIVRSELNGFRIAEVPTTLRKDGRSKAPHLRSFRDGWRHLKLLLMYAPNWLLLYPGLLFLFLGLISGGVLAVDRITANNRYFSIHTLLYCAGLMMIGLSILQAYLIFMVYAYNHGFFPRHRTDWNKKIKEDRIIFTGGILVLLGIILSIAAAGTGRSFGTVNSYAGQTMEIVIPAVFCLVAGFQFLCSGFMVGAMKTSTENKV